MKTVELLAIIISLSSAFIFSNALGNQPQNKVMPQPAPQTTTDDDFEPIDNMHHFMRQKSVGLFLIRGC